MDFVAYGGAALGIVLAVKTFLRGGIGLAGVIYMILLSAEFFLPMRRLGSYFHVAMNGMAASDKFFHFLGAAEPEAKRGTVSGGGIALEDVHFSYDGVREVLRGVSIDVPERGFVGIVGESGSGKSTVATLIMGRCTATNGRVTVGGTPMDAQA